MKEKFICPITNERNFNDLLIILARNLTNQQWHSSEEREREKKKYKKRK